jgi:hypothetical protein
MRWFQASFGSLEIRSNHFQQLFSGIGVERLRMLIGIHQVSEDVLLDYLRHQPRHCPASSRDQVHHLVATDLAIQRALDSLDLPTDAANPSQQLLFLSDGVRHAVVIAYPPILY